MRRHLPAMTSGVAFGKVLQRQVPRGHAPTENKPPVAIVRNNVIACIQLNGNSDQRFMSHAGDMKMALALANQILLTQVGMATFQNRFKQSKLIFLAERGHMISMLYLHLRIDNRADLFRIENNDGHGKTNVGTEQGSNRTVP